MTLHGPLILSERVIIAIRAGWAIKAECVCVGHTCQHFINKVNHRLQSCISPGITQNR